MYSMNKVQFVGHLGKDVELRYSPAGNAFGSTSIATARRVKQSDGTYKDATDWHNLVLMGKTAENANKHLGKGSYVFVEGRLQTRKWADQDGNDKYTTEVIVNTIGYLEPKEGSATTGNGNGMPPAPGEDFDDDIPF